MVLSFSRLEIRSTRAPFSCRNGSYLHERVLNCSATLAEKSRTRRRDVLIKPMWPKQLLLAENGGIELTVGVSHSGFQFLLVTHSVVLNPYTETPDKCLRLSGV